MFLPQPKSEDYPKEVLRNGTPLEPSKNNKLSGHPQFSTGKICKSSKREKAITGQAKKFEWRTGNSIFK